MSRPLVYLFGPITGLTYGDAQDWRTALAAELDTYGIDAVSPLRMKHYLAQLGELSGHGRDFSGMNVLSDQQSVITRDKFDVLRADMLVGNFLGATRVSIGSMFEQAWAHLQHKPIAVAIEKEGNPHDHMFFNGTVGFRVESLRALADVVIATLAKK